MNDSRFMNRYLINPVMAATYVFGAQYIEKELGAEIPRPVYIFAPAAAQLLVMLNYAREDVAVPAMRKIFHRT